MNANQDILQSQWPTLKGQVKQQWGNLTADDIARLSGHRAELASLLRQRYGYGQAQAELEINHWMKEAEVQPSVSGSDPITQ